MNETPNIIGGIHATARSLQIQQLGMDTAGGNIANANTPQYGRADLHVLAGGLGQLNQDAQVSRAESPISEHAVHDAHRAFKFSEAHYDYLRVQVAPLLGDLSANNLVQSLGAFFTAWRTLAIEPGSLELRRSLLGRGEALCNNLQNAASGIRTQQFTLDRAVQGLLVGANTSIEEVAGLNGQIRSLKAGGQSSLDAENRRARLVHQLVGDLGVDVLTDADGSSRLLVAGGIAVVSGDASLPVATRLDAVTGFSHVVVDPSADRNLDRFITGGKLGAMLTTRDTDLGGFAGTLDQLCADLATTVNTQHQAGFGLDAVGNRDFFAAPPAPVSGYAGAIALDPAVATVPAAIGAASAAANLPSESANSDLVGALGDGLFAAGNTLTFSQGLRSLATQSGQVTAQARIQAEQEEARLRSAEAVRDAQMGVSQQEQIVAARRAQMAYQMGLKVLDLQFGQIDALLALRSR